MKDYKPRISDELLKLKLEAFGAALIIGPKGCGKTTTAKQQAKNYVEFQVEDERENYLLIANTHPSDLLIGDKPRLFDDCPFSNLLAANGLSKPFADDKYTGDSRYSGARGCGHLDGTK